MVISAEADWEPTVPLQYDINNSDIGFEFDVQVPVLFGEAVDEDL